MARERSGQARNRRELALLRLVAQRIAGPGLSDAAHVVRWLGAIQAQNLPGAVTSVALRAQEGSRTAVDAAFDSGAVVRSWPMRGTLHLVPGEDLGWMLGLTRDRTLASLRSRHAELGVTEHRVERARELAVETLAGGRSCSRRHLKELWDAAGLLEGAAQQSNHLMMSLTQSGTLCLGPVRDGGQHAVLLDEWVPAPRLLDREEALAEWTLRYFRSHGPATVKDFAWWTKLTLADTRTGLAHARPELESMEVDGVEYLMDPTTPELLAEHRPAARRLHLLPGFDEFILGYRDRSGAVPAEFADRIIPGGNGVFRSTVVSAGQVIGTWKADGRTGIAPTAFTSFSPRTHAAITRRYAALP